MSGLKIEYETLEEARMRLENTVVVYDGDPVYVSKVGSVERRDEAGAEANDIFRVYINPLPLNGDNPRKKPFEKSDLDNDDRALRRYISSKKFDLSPFKMGYVNYNDTAVFTARTTARQNKQGLSAGSCVINPHPESEFRANFIAIISSSGFLEMFKNTYPDFKQGVESICSESREIIACSRTFAFRSDDELDLIFAYHRGKKIGFCEKTQVNGIKLPDKFKYLKEELEEARIPLN